MKAIINKREFEIIECKKVTGYGTYAIAITFKKSTIDGNSLDELLTENEAAEGEVVIVHDSGEKVTYSGFTNSHSYECNKTVIIARLNALPPLEKKVAELTSLVKAKDETINALTEELTTVQMALCALYESTLPAEPETEEAEG